MMAASCVVEDITGRTSPTLTTAILIRTPKWVLLHLPYADEEPESSKGGPVPRSQS